MDYKSHKNVSGLLLSSWPGLPHQCCSLLARISTLFLTVSLPDLPHCMLSPPHSRYRALVSEGLRRIRITRKMQSSKKEKQNIKVHKRGQMLPADIGTSPLTNSVQ
ncbi:hypothetical protein PoB_001583500 [Plakobranchus ocellatus]|uniref:Nuclear transcription factor Y subunit n=1 Tax=Plakobranchus ocellatus TaxID=259542 RepID=A0AAV3Z1R2_9GAST|nr:hypothetical protein PoB_001583500 [Plakobranchus ocellatus]